MAQAKNGDTVKVMVQLKFANGGRPPADTLTFTLGEGKVLVPGMERAVIGMRPGEAKTVRIPTDKAYGPHREELVLAVSRTRFPRGSRLEVGEKLLLADWYSFFPNLSPEVDKQLRLHNPDKRGVVCVIIAANELLVVLDANHPYAGEDLVFDIALLKIL